MKTQILLYSIMNMKIKRILFVVIVLCIILLVLTSIQREHYLCDLQNENDMLISYVAYSIEMMEGVSIEDMESNIFPEKNALVYSFSESMCDDCIYQDLTELYELQKVIGKDKVLLITSYATDRMSRIILKNKLHNFRYLNLSLDSIKFPIDCATKMERRFFGLTDESGKLCSMYFPIKDKQSLTRIYLNGAKSFILSQ